MIGLYHHIALGLFAGFELRGNPLWEKPAEIDAAMSRSFLHDGRG